MDVDVDVDVEVDVGVERASMDAFLNAVGWRATIIQSSGSVVRTSAETKRWSRNERETPAWSSCGTESSVLSRLANTVSLGSESSASASRDATVPLDGLEHWGKKNAMTAERVRDRRRTYLVHVASSFPLEHMGMVGDRKLAPTGRMGCECVISARKAVQGVTQGPTSRGFHT